MWKKKEVFNPGKRKIKYGLGTVRYKFFFWKKYSSLKYIEKIENIEKYRKAERGNKSFHNLTI